MDVQNSRIGKRLRAIGMLESGISQKQIAQTLGVTIKTVWNWKTKILSGKSMAGKPRSGRQYYIKEILRSSNLKEKVNRPNDRTENVSLDVRGYFYAGWGSCPYRQKDANLAFQSYSRLLGKRNLA